MAARKKKKSRAMPRALPETIPTMLLRDDELKVRIKRRVGPSLLGIVDVVLAATLDAVATLGEKDPWDK